MTTSGVHIAGDQLRKRRKLLGDRLIDFAPKVGISVQYLSQIELGDRRSVSPTVFARICDELGIAKDERGDLLAEAGAA